MTILEAVEKAIEDASHLSGEDSGAIEALRALARKIDAWDEIVKMALEDADESGSRPKVPAQDTAWLATCLKCCESIGLIHPGRNGLGLSEGVEVRPVDDLKRKRRQRAQKAGSAYTSFVDEAAT